MDLMALKRKLNLLWYATLPGGIVAIIGVIWYADQASGFAGKSAVDPALAGWLPEILGGITLLMFGVAMFMKTSFLPQRARALAGEDPAEHLKALMFVQLGASDAPCIVAIALFALTGQEWMLVGGLVYAFLASVLFKPDFDRLFALMTVR